MNDFRIALAQYGEGKWDLIRKKAQLHKSNQQIEEYYRVLVQQCQELAKKEKDNVSEEDEEKQIEIEDKPQESKQALTVSMAKRLLTRLQLFSDLRDKVLPHEEIEKRMMEAELLKMPDWWVAGNNY
jgi:hypothetical protein